MNITYVGCKSRMPAERRMFVRGKTVDVPEETAVNLLKIDGFVTKMDAAAKKELAFNADREKFEQDKLNKKVVVVKVADDDLKKAYENLLSENELLKAELEELKQGSQVEVLLAEIEELKAKK